MEVQCRYDARTAYTVFYGMLTDLYCVCDFCHKHTISIRVLLLSRVSSLYHIAISQTSSTLRERLIQGTRTCHHRLTLRTTLRRPAPPASPTDRCEASDRIAYIHTSIQYAGEDDLQLVMELIDNELSEPYSIFTYRCDQYHNNPHSTNSPYIQVLFAQLAASMLPGLPRRALCGRHHLQDGAPSPHASGLPCHAGGGASLPRR